MQRTLLLSLGLLTAGLTAQGTATRLATPSETAAFAVQSATVQQLSVTTPSPDVATIRGERRFEVELGGVLREITLRPKNKLADGFKLVENDGKTQRVVPTPASVTFVGSVDGVPEARVAGSVVDGQVTMLVRLQPSNDLFYNIQPLTTEIPTAAANEHIVHTATDLLPTTDTCGVTGPGALPPLGTGPGIAFSQANLSVAEIGCDADFQFFQANQSSSANTMNQITTIMTMIDAIYCTDVGIEHMITQIIVRTTSNDPYTQSNAGARLNEFASEWNGPQSGIQRDVAHLFTGINLAGSTIGVAFLAQICNVGGAYGLSQRLTNMIAQVGVTAHELGHNWSANHCDALGDCRIMCSGLGGCLGDVSQFGGPSINSIVSFRNSRGCLSAPNPPTLGGISPGSAQTFAAGTVTLTGNSLQAVDEVRFNGTPLPVAQWNVVNSSTINIFPQNPPSIGIGFWGVSNPFGSSNQLPFLYQQTSPEVHTASVASANGAPYTLRFGGAPGDAYFGLIAVDPTTFNFGGLDILLTFEVIATGTLDAAGLAEFTITVPPSPDLAGLSLLSQGVFIGSVFTVSPVDNTLFF